MIILWLLLYDLIWVCQKMWYTSKWNFTLVGKIIIEHWIGGYFISTHPHIPSKYLEAMKTLGTCVTVNGPLRQSLVSGWFNSFRIEYWLQNWTSDAKHARASSRLNRHSHRTSRSDASGSATSFPRRRLDHPRNGKTQHWTSTLGGQDAPLEGVTMCHFLVAGLPLFGGPTLVISITKLLKNGVTLW